MKAVVKYIILVFAIFLYSTIGIFTRSAAAYSFLSWQYILWVAGAVVMMGVYAILWQQLIQRLDLSLAYMFKGLGGIFGLALCYFVFQEQITIRNILGAAIVIIGITIYAWTNEKEKGGRG